MSKMRRLCQLIKKRDQWMNDEKGKSIDENVTSVDEKIKSMDEKVA